MNLQEPLDNEVLVLYPPNPSEATRPVVGAECGVPKHVYDLKPMGLRVDVPPALAGTVDPGDVVRLILNGKEEASRPIEPGEENEYTTQYIPKGLLLPNRVNELVYTITRASQNVGTSTPPLTLLYNDIRPGNEDTTPGDGSHSRLQLTLPQDVIDYGIDDERAREGVEVFFEYPYCRPYDSIRLNCNGYDVQRDVSADEAPTIPTDTPSRIRLTLDESVFERAGDHPQFVFNFTVFDQLGNGPDPDSPWSESVVVTVDLKGARLVAPDITEDPDDPNDAPDTIDLNKLGSSDLTIQVHVLAPPWATDDIIRVKYVAIPNAGGAPVEHSAEATVVRIPFVQKLMTPNAKVIPDSLVRVSYEQVRDGAVVARSRVAIARVILAPVITSLRNSTGAELENGGTVSDNKVTLAGSALAGMVLQIFDGTTFVEEVRTGADYKWKSTALSIAVGRHVYTAREKEGNQFVSEPWVIERLAFSIDRTQMRLEGFSVKIPQWPKTGEDSVGNTGIRVPTGGVPPYQYASSDPLTAPVTNSGKVTGLKNGVATIYVTDNEGETLSYLAVITNIFKLQISEEKMHPVAAIEWMHSLGGQTTYNSLFQRDIKRVYVPVIPEYIFTCVIYGSYNAYMRTDGSFFTIPTIHIWNAWCLIPI
jgi:hypothetical protein